MITEYTVHSYERIEHRRERKTDVKNDVYYRCILSLIVTLSRLSEGSLFLDIIDHDGS